MNDETETGEGEESTPIEEVGTETEDDATDVVAEPAEEAEEVTEDDDIPDLIDESVIIEAERLLVEDTPKPTTPEDGEQPFAPVLVNSDYEEEDDDQS